MLVSESNIHVLTLRNVGGVAPGAGSSLRLCQVWVASDAIWFLWEYHSNCFFMLRVSLPSLFTKVWRHFAHGRLICVSLQFTNVTMVTLCSLQAVLH